MQRRATSKKRAAEAERELEIDMDNKEATPVEVEELLPPVLSKQTEQSEEQPEMLTQTEKINVPEKETEDMTVEEMLRAMMKNNKSLDKERKEDKLALNKKFEELKGDNQSLKEDIKSSKEETNKKIEENSKKMEENSKKMEERMRCV